MKPLRRQFWVQPEGRSWGRTMALIPDQIHNPVWNQILERVDVLTIRLIHVR